MNNNTAEQGCTLETQQLIFKVHQWVHKLAETGGKAWSLQVPVNFNEDPDMLIIEVCKRLSAAPSPSTEAIEFAKWIGEEKYQWNGDGTWDEFEGLHVFTTEQLYQMFKNKIDK